MPGLPDTFASTVLDFITGRGGAATYIALMYQDPGVDPLMASIPEVTSAGYARQLVSFVAPTLSPRGTGNELLFTFGPFPSGMPSGATYAALVEDPTGSMGKVRYVWVLDTVLQAAPAESVQFPLNSLTLGW